MAKNSQNQQREKSLVERFHKLMMANQPIVTVKESDATTDGTSIDIEHRGEFITITLAENSEENSRNNY